MIGQDDLPCTLEETYGNESGTVVAKNARRENIPDRYTEDFSKNIRNRYEFRETDFQVLSHKPSGGSLSVRTDDDSSDDKASLEEQIVDASKKTEKGTEIKAMLGSDLIAQGKKVANPDMYYEVTGRDEDGDGKYIGNEILTWKQLEDAKTVFNAEADLLGTWGMTSDEAKKILESRGIELPSDVTSNPDFEKFRVEAKTDKHGNYTVKVLTPLGASLFEDFKEGEVAKRHAATLEQRQNHFLMP